MNGDPLFRDRRDAGQQLATALTTQGLKDPLVLALPRGGVPVAFEVARALQAQLDLMIVRKIGAPGHPEYAIGAVADGFRPQTILDPDAMAVVHPSSQYVAKERARQVAEIERRRAAYFGNRKAIDVANRVVVLVDDGIATGSTAKVAIAALRADGAAEVILAIPVAPASVIATMKGLADRVICLATPAPFHAVSLHYAAFDQTTDAEVIALLAEAGKVATPVPARAAS